MPTTERDPTPFLIALFGLVILVAGLVAAWATRRRAKAEERSETSLAEERQKREALLAEAVEAGTHLANGRPRCQITPCVLEATMPAPKIVRSTSARDYVAKLGNIFGRLFDPPRYKVVMPHPHEVDELTEHRVPLVHCEPHSHLAEQECRLEVADGERSRQAGLRDVEARLAKFERGGLTQRLIAMEEKK